MMRVAIITVSDRSSRGEREDKGGPALREVLEGSGASIVFEKVVPDEVDLIRSAILEASRQAELVLTTGGTGVAPRDVTPEATRSVLDKEIPGLGELMRAESLKKTPMASLSRATAGVCARALVINLPGSPRGAKECLQAVLPVVPHALALIRTSEKD